MLVHKLGYVVVANGVISNLMTSLSLRHQGGSRVSQVAN